MPLTKIEAEIEIPEGFEFDNVIKDPLCCVCDAQLGGYKIILRKKPKPAKPAYRVYIEKNDNQPETVTLAHYEKYRNSYDDKVKWISDWVEYDQPKQWPTPLVERIAAIDLKAAKWIVEHWDDLSTDEYNFEGRYSRESEKLKTMFSWGQSGIDNHIWYRISEKLGE